MSDFNEHDTADAPDRKVSAQTTSIPTNRISFLLATCGDALGAGVEGGRTGVQAAAADTVVESALSVCGDGERGMRANVTIPLSPMFPNQETYDKKET